MARLLTQVLPPTNGQNISKEEWVLIREVTIKEKVNAIIINRDSENREFEVDDIMIEGIFYGDTNNPVSSNMGLTCGSYYKTNLSITSNSQYFYWSAKSTTIANKRTIQYTSAIANKSDSDTSSTTNVQSPYVEVENTKIKSITLNVINTNCKFGLNTTFRVYGKKVS